MEVQDHIVSTSAVPIRLMKGPDLVAMLHFGEDVVRVSQEGVVDEELGRHGLWLAGGEAYVARSEGRHPSISVSLFDPSLRIEIPQSHPLAKFLNATRLRLCLAVALTALNQHLGHPIPHALDPRQSVVHAV